MSERELQHDLFLLVGFLLSSAHGLYDEPAEYGPFRLLDAARRLAETMGRHGLGDPSLERLHTALEEACTGAAGDEELRRIADGLVLDYARELNGRLST